MARNKPVKICRIRQIPRRDPKFHHAEIFDGVGRSMNELLIIFISGWVFRMLVISVLVVELQRWLFMSLVMVRFHVGIMLTYIVGLCLISCCYIDFIFFFYCKYYFCC